jgi:hypothetical protein
MVKIRVVEKQDTVAEEEPQQNEQETPKEDVEEEDQSIEIKEEPIQEPVKKRIGRPPNPPKEKKVYVRTEAQKQATLKMLAVRDANAAKRKTEREERDAIFKEEMEKKIVKKAVVIKQRQLKKAAVLDIVSDDDEPAEEVIRKVYKRAVKEIPVPVQPKYIFL